VALLVSAQGWDGFPPKLKVYDVVLLSTPHQGVANPSAADDRHENTYNLRYWHAAGDQPPHHTPDNGWSPLKTALQAATRIGDGLPN
jgi:hypothetical protein